MTLSRDKAIIGAMEILSELIIIALLSIAGGVIAAMLPFAFPPAVISLFLLLLLLFLGVIKEDGLSSSSSFFLKYMAMFFVPSGVEIIEYADLLSSSWFHIILISAISMLITFFAAAKAVEITERLMQRRKAA